VRHGYPGSPPIRLTTRAGQKTRSSIARSARGRLGSARLVRISSRAELSFQLGRYNQPSRASSRAAHELIELSVKGQMIYTQPSKPRSPNGPAQHWQHILRPRRPAKNQPYPSRPVPPTRQLPRRPHASRKAPHAGTPQRPEAQIDGHRRPWTRRTPPWATAHQTAAVAPSPAAHRTPRRTEEPGKPAAPASLDLTRYVDPSLLSCSLIYLWIAELLLSCHCYVLVLSRGHGWRRR
jgi:hypothetical protein